MAAINFLMALIDFADRTLELALKCPLKELFCFHLKSVDVDDAGLHCAAVRNPRRGPTIDIRR
jgi:hypothetical protein